MDPQYAQRLREEVIYLHSLWHRGPPRPAAGRQAPKLLQPSNTAHFKSEGRPGGRRGRKSKKKNPRNQAHEPMPSPGKEWQSITPSPAEATSSWGSLAAKPFQLPSSEEQLKFVEKNAQKRALKTVLEFLRSNDDDADSESGSVDSSSDEDDEFMDEDDGRQEYTFFLKVLTVDAELKDYYEKNFAKGEFICLICGAVGGKNAGKKFKGCLPLVQHSITVAKTKRRRAHRAYGQAVCKIFGWDIDRLSTVVSSLSDNLDGVQVGQKADDKDNSIGVDKKVVSEDGNNGDVVPQTAAFGSGSLPFTDKEITVGQKADDKDNSIGVDKKVVFEDGIDGDVVPQTAAFGSGSLPFTDKGITNSIGTDVNNTLEGLDVVEPSNVEETATGGFTISFSVANDANNITEGLGVVDLSNVEETVAERSTIGSLMGNSGVGIVIANDDGKNEEDGTSNRELSR